MTTCAIPAVEQAQANKNEKVFTLNGIIINTKNLRIIKNKNKEITARQCYKIDKISVIYDRYPPLYVTSANIFSRKNRNTVILFLYLRKLYLENMEEYIGTVIRVGGIAIGCVMVLFVIWYAVKDILDISGKDSSDGK